LLTEQAGFPHAFVQDDIYNSYFIPKGAAVIPNRWAILHDEKLYLDPESFRPERWLEPGYLTHQGPHTKYPNLNKFPGLGHGRRICPGLEVYEQSVLLQVSSLYWACSILREKDANGSEIEIPYYDYTGVLVAMLQNFQVRVEERRTVTLKIMDKSSTCGSQGRIGNGS